MSIFKQFVSLNLSFAIVEKHVLKYIHEKRKLTVIDRAPGSIPF